MAHSVLLVEDDKGIATVITEALREDGFDVTACESIARRDTLLADNRFDVMLTDVMLEDGDGLASIDTVRRLAPAMPVIVLSAQLAASCTVTSSFAHCRTLASVPHTVTLPIILPNALPPTRTVAPAVR